MADLENFWGFDKQLIVIFIKKIFRILFDKSISFTSFYQYYWADFKGLMWFNFIHSTKIEPNELVL
ncbi:hypothetical protein C0134_08700 [Moraxella catarrhalis]|nr:hypothetical protein CEP83_06370 [Moraxella catarrhalis]EGE12885.1 hypothetical protein E9K_07338 [Moraxella catarrhalis 103P14B1]EGE14338.1 hypothetical protein E9O_07248 [Moraxella catarrhalis 12P80B1]EGE23483.1 hypothetical protein E9Y_07911 [Moraxella catarrhalis 101P30B1]EGE27643.1 hypothetical protein EA1_01573 [Moraxella catarrhalis O35E]